MAYEKLTVEAIEQELRTVDGWMLRTEADAISKSFRFKTFRQAFGFMTECALAAERLNHHPDWSNSYSRVDIVLSTHDVQGLTELDFKLARAIDKASAGRI